MAHGLWGGVVTEGSRLWSGSRGLDEWIETSALGAWWIVVIYGVRRRAGG